MSRAAFSSWLAPFFERHVTLKRAAGRDFSTSRSHLIGFDRYLTSQDVVAPLTKEDLREFLASLTRPSPRGRDNVVCAVWPALAFARRRGAAIEPLPERPRPAPVGSRQREPFVLSHAQAERLFRATHDLAPTRVFTRRTHATLLGLLYTTGMRVGEARALDIGDFDRNAETLLVRAGKFQKTRLLPLSPSTTEALGRYLDDPLRPIGSRAEDPVFVSRRKRRLSHPAICQMLRKVAQLAGLDGGQGTLRPHDLRHTFAVHRLLAWHREGRDVNALLPVLSTYLGHVSPAHTYTYLRDAKLLIAEAAQSFEHAVDEALKGRQS